MLENMVAIIRIRGKVHVRNDIKYTLKLLRLNRKMHCVIIKKNKVYEGMLQKVKDYVTWGEISEEILKNIIEKRGRKIGNKRLTKEEAEEVFNDFVKNGKSDKIKPVFRLTPPSGGFKKSIKQHFPNGELGYRGNKINDLLKRMI
ncbi:MAG: 50S ribosomal protein L30 [Candidatus Aenigmatarchaeota archaeon]